MTPLVAAWLIAFVAFALVFFQFRQQAGALLIYSVVLTIIFFTPGLYYLSGGTAYRVFSDHAFDRYLLLAATLFVASTFLVLAKIALQSRLARHGPAPASRPNELTLLYALAVLGVCSAYVAVFFREFALVSILTGGGRIARLDTSGAVPMYFTVSTLFHIVIPSAVVLWLPYLNSRVAKASLVLLGVFFLAISGHRGIVAFFLIFLWAFVLHRRIGLVAILGGVFLLTLYSVVQGVTELDSETLMYAVSAPSRRLFVTQGAGTIVRLHLLDSGFLFDAAGIKEQIFRYVYGSSSAGSMPTFFLADLLVLEGPWLAGAAMACFFGLVTLAAAWIDARHPHNLVMQWHFFVAVYFIGFSEIGVSNALRFLVIFLNLGVIHFLASRSRQGLQRQTV